MRYATVTVHEISTVHPIARQVAETAGVSREAVVHFNVLNDGTGILLIRLRGDLDRVRDRLADRSDVLAYDVSGRDEGIAYVQARPTEALEQLLAIRREHEVFFEMPIERIREDAARVTVIGETSAAVQRALEDFPDSLEFTLERTGEYPRAADDLAGLLTDRQLDVLETAVGQGYYETPRRTTLQAIAEELGLSTGTVSEHLRKAERRVFSAIVERA